MDFFQGVVEEYLRADRACFINSEFWLRGNLDKKGSYQKPHWYVDILAVHMRLQRIYLCEVTYAKKGPALIKRLQSWREHWGIIQQTLREDSHLPDWPVQPWIFAPASVLTVVQPAVKELHPAARFESLEKIMPWLYRTWDREDDGAPAQVDLKL